MKLKAGMLAGVAAIGLLAAGGYVYTRPEPAPMVQFTPLSGGKLGMEALRGKVVLVNFWATSCESCVHEMPKMVETYRRYAPRGYEMVAVAMSYDHPNYVAAYAQKNQLPFTVALDASGEVAKRFGNVMVTPTTYLIDRRGNIVKRYLGEPKWDEFHALVEKKLAEPA
jgi:peroxiredoxin